MQVKPICFFLPQFHPIELNDRAWGNGFTDWTNVAKTQPRFVGHVQPKVPGSLGYYDLRDPTVLERQARIATENGVFGFCFYYYRFGERRLLETPLENLLARPTPDLPFCFCWANESWTRAWDGRSSEVLIALDYSEVTWCGLADDLARAFRDERYIRVDGRPLVLIYQIDSIPDPTAQLANFREMVLSEAREEIYLGTVFSRGLTEAMARSVDFVVQFPPHRMPGRKQRRQRHVAADVEPYRPELGDYFEPYDAVVSDALSLTGQFAHVYPGVCPDWDNSPRRESKAFTLVGGTPEKFRDWVAEAGRIALGRYRSGELRAPFLFVNAWNEWAEGAFLEPSEHLGTRYLEALREGLQAAERPKKRVGWVARMFGADRGS